MSKVFFSVTMSLDGFIAPEFMELGRPPEQWINEWMELQKYVFEQRFFRENLKLGDGGETGEDNRILEAAAACNAILIVSDDTDLLSLSPWRGTPIVTSKEFVTRTDAMRRSRKR